MGVEISVLREGRDFSNSVTWEDYNPLKKSGTIIFSRLELEELGWLRDLGQGTQAVPSPGGKPCPFVIIVSPAPASGEACCGERELGTPSCIC